MILSGRRKNSRQINSANSKIIRHCLETAKPLLGICYGAEIIALTMGGTIRKMPTHIHGNQILTIDQANLLTKDKGSIIVYESHAFCVARLPTEFVGLAGSVGCKYELFAHNEKPVFGTQFHPEKSGTDGLDLLLNFVKLRHEQFYLQGKNA